MKPLLKLFPTIGILLYIALYIFSASLYPGGSQADLNAKGFDWINNYWCNLLNVEAMNGALNPARPFAMAAMIILCFSMALFFYLFPKFFFVSKFWKTTTQVSGGLAMTFAVLIFTDYHDVMTSLASIFGLFALIGIFVGLIKNKSTGYLLAGGFCIFLIAVNNYIYYSKQFLVALPLIQKITFAIMLVWVMALNVEFLKKKCN